LPVQKIARYAKYFDLAIVADEKLTLSFTGEAKSLFRSMRVFTPSTVPAGGVNSHLLVICGNKALIDSSAFKTLLSSVTRLETGILTPDYESPDLLKAALSYRAIEVSDLPSTQNDFYNFLLRIFPHLIKHYNESLKHEYQHQIIEHSNYLFAVLKKNKTIFASEALKHHFGISDLVDFDRYINEQGLGHLLKTPGSNQEIVSGLENMLEGESKYFISTHPLKEGETVLGMIPMKETLRDREEQLLNRMSFIELLKDAFLIHDSEDNPLPVILIRIENSDKIIEHHGPKVYNDIYKEIISRARNYFGNDANIAQWHKDVSAIMSMDGSIESLKTTLERFHQDAVNHVNIEGATPVLDSFVIDLHGVELNKAIQIIDHMHQKQLLLAEIADLAYYEIGASQSVEDEEEEALYYMEKILQNKAPIKLLNFYKGIRISTSGRLIKIADTMAYIAIEKMQGYAMKLEGHTVIQSPSFPFDLQANVKIVDIGKKVALLSSYQPLHVSANNRQYIRIQSDHRMHVTLTTAKNVNSGTIIDISIKSIACRINNLKITPEIGTAAMLQFSLPLPRLDGGMASMSVGGKIQYIQKEEEFTKVVVILDLEEPYESFLIEYIYNRQQSLVNEIKSIANKL